MASDRRLAFWDEGNSNTWIAAGTTFVNAAYNSLTHTLGHFGYDPNAGGTGVGGVWAVVNYGGSFAAIPEPTTALAGLLLTAGLLRRRRA